ncbi:MAG: hypothetical protein R3E95_06760 [Thiolinea sp.]
MDTQMIYYWKSGAWTNDKETADLAVELLEFPRPEMVDLDIEADVEQKYSV